MIIFFSSLFKACVACVHKADSLLKPLFRCATQYLIMSLVLKTWSTFFIIFIFLFSKHLFASVFYFLLLYVVPIRLGMLSQLIRRLLEKPFVFACVFVWLFKKNNVDRKKPPSNYPFICCFLSLVILFPSI